MADKKKKKPIKDKIRMQLNVVRRPSDGFPGWVVLRAKATPKLGAIYPQRELDGVYGGQTLASCSTQRLIKANQSCVMSADP